MIELMIVVAVTAILVAVAMPKFGGLMDRARESQVLSALGVVRSALSVYYADSAGVEAATLSALENYLRPPVPPYIHLPNLDHGRLNSEQAALNDAGDWWYAPLSLGGPGTARINCTHADSRGRIWSTR